MDKINTTAKMRSIPERHSVSQISLPMVLRVMETPTFPIILLSKALFPGGLPSMRLLPERADTLAHYPRLEKITLVLIS